MTKRCKICGCFLDPNKWCDCEDHPQLDQEMARRPVARNRTVYPSEYNTEEYIRQRWREFDLR